MSIYGSTTIERSRVSVPQEQLVVKAKGQQRKVKELVLIFGNVIKSLGRSLHFTCNALEQGRQASARFKMLLATIGLVCPEARVKFKNIDFQTEADFACYCSSQRSNISFNLKGTWLFS